jgi:hypothetical protein
MLPRYCSAILLILAFASIGISQQITNGVEMTTINAPWVLRILGHELDLTNVQAKPDQRSAYFLMQNDALSVSVFIEPVDKCKTAEKCRDYVLGLGNPKWGKFQNLVKGTLGEASYFEFYRPEVDGQPVKMLDMYAEFVVDGYWVDIHISKQLYEKKHHSLFENVAKDAKFIPKSSKDASTFDTLLTKGRAAAAEWLSLWDKSKGRESYRAMSALTRAEIEETSWTDYCTKINGISGELKSREPIAAAFTSSLKGKTDRPLALLAYHTKFAKRPSVVEIVGLMLESDNRWRATNYLPN